jgi:multiple sugar transport system substrate-binding protein
MTWDHSRGFDPMVETSAIYAAAHPGVTIGWERRSLQAFADRPIEAMTDEYDLLVIDHPHVGEVSRKGLLVPLNGVGRDDEIRALAAQSVGVSHPSYVFERQQWALAVDAATPVACFRPDRLEKPPVRWDEMIALARTGEVCCALVPINALMTFFGLARNKGYAIAEEAEFMAPSEAAEILEHMRELVALIERRCLELDPIGIYEWMARTGDAPSYSPFGYGYTNYSRGGYRPYPLVYADAPGFGDNGPRGTVIGGTGIAVSARSEHRDIAIDYAFWVAGAECQSGPYFASGGQPANAEAWDDDACNAASRDFFRNTRATLETAWMRPRYDGYMGLQGRGGDIVHACLRSEQSVTAAVVALQSAYKESRK